MISKQLEIVEPDQLDLRLSFLRSVSAESVDRMKASLNTRGQLTPITVVMEKDRMVLVDGFKRRQAALSLGLDGLMATVTSAGTVESKAMIYLLNRPGTFSMVSEAVLIRDLVEVEGLSQSETAVLLDRHKSWVSRRLTIIKSLAPEIVDDMKLKLLPPGVGSSLARLPRCNQVDFSAAIIKHGLRSKEVRKLVDLWCKAKEPAVRQCLLDSPHCSLEITAGNMEGQESWQSQFLAIYTRITKLCRKLHESEISGHTAANLHSILVQIISQIQKAGSFLKEVEK